MEETFQGYTYKVKKKIPLRRKILLVIFILLCILLLLFIAREIYDIGELRSVKGIPDPIQTPADGRTRIDFLGGEANITFEYAYEIEGLAVHTRRYFGLIDMGNAISPMDVGLVWGRVAEMNKQMNINWGHGERYLKIEDVDAKDLMAVGGVDYLNTHLSNNHLIPADSSVRRKVKKIRRGDHIKIKGYLVSVYGKRWGREYTWDSSTTRNDNGCEVIYVTDVEFLD